MVAVLHATTAPSCYAGHPRNRPKFHLGIGFGYWAKSQTKFISKWKCTANRTNLSTGTLCMFRSRISVGNKATSHGAMGGAFKKTTSCNLLIGWTQWPYAVRNHQNAKYRTNGEFGGSTFAHGQTLALVPYRRIPKLEKLKDWLAVRAACMEKKNAPKGISSAERRW